MFPYLAYRIYFPLYILACILFGYAAFDKALPRQGSTADISSIAKIQTSASLAAYYGGGWKQTPDALCLRGLGQLLRNNFAETVLDISMARTLKTTHPWRYPEISGPATDSILAMARNKLSPAIGIWSKVDPSFPGKRYAAG